MGRELDMPQRIRTLVPNENQALWLMGALIAAGLVASVLVRL